VRVAIGRGSEQNHGVFMLLLLLMMMMISS